MAISYTFTMGMAYIHNLYLTIHFVDTLINKMLKNEIKML